MYKAIITSPAEEDLISTINYINDALKNPIAANNLLDKFNKTSIIYKVVILI